MNRTCPKCGAKGWFWSKVIHFGRSLYHCMGCDRLFE